MVWERIQELKRQEEQRARDKAAQEKADRMRLAQEAAQKAADRLKIAQEATVKARLQQEQERQRALEAQEAKRKANKEVFESSGILSNMREIEKGLRGNVRKHAMLVDLDAGTATLAWGRKFIVSYEGWITYEKDWLARGKMNYSYITADVNLPSQSVTIGHIEVEKDQWSTNKTIVQDLLAQAYLHPKRVNQRETPPSPPSKYSSSSSSPTTECCNN